MPNDIPLDWEQVVDRHAEQVFRIAFRILGTVHDAEDVSQNVFMEAVAIQQAAPIQTWKGLLIRLATLRAIDLLRRRRRTVSLQEENLVSNVGPPEEAVGAELANWLRTAVAQLPEQQSAIFSLTYFEQLDRNEVAEIFHISPESVSTALYKARQRLMTQIAVFNGEQS